MGTRSQAGCGTFGSDAPSRTDEAPPDPRDDTRDWDADPPPAFMKDLILFGKYRLIEKLGEGGMGEVWRIWHVELEVERALKLIKPEFARNDIGWRRFRREAQLMARIDHINAVAAFDFRHIQSMGYIEMKLVRGRTLHDILKSRSNQPMPLEWTSQVLDQLCSVLQEAHDHAEGAPEDRKANPIIHRDLKPSNLMLIKERLPGQDLKVLDFGIAKMVAGESGGDLTAAGDLLGTPAYMSPEQIRVGAGRTGEQELDGRSDIYSTGVLLYQLLTGSLPFRDGTLAVLGAHFKDPPPPMKEANPGVEVPVAIERLEMECLEKDPARRPRSARELAERFRKAIPARRPTSTPRSKQAIRWVGFVLASILLVGVPLALVGQAPRVRPKTGTTINQLDPAARKGSPPDPLSIDIDLRTSRPSNELVPGETMFILVSNRSNRPAYVELVGKSSDGKEFILIPGSTSIATGGTLRFPEFGQIRAGSRPGQERISVYARAIPLPRIVRPWEEGGPDHTVDPSDRNASGPDSTPITQKTITVTTRSAPGSHSPRDGRAPED